MAHDHQVEHEKRKLHEKLVKQWRRSSKTSSWWRPKVEIRCRRLQQHYLVPPEDPKKVKHLFLSGGSMRPFVNQPLCERLIPEQSIVPLVKGYDPPVYDFDRQIYDYPRYDPFRRQSIMKERISKASEAKDAIIQVAKDDIHVKEEQLRMKTLKAIFGDDLKGYREPRALKVEEKHHNTAVFIFETVWWLICCCFFDEA